MSLLRRALCSAAKVCESRGPFAKRSISKNAAAENANNTARSPWGASTTQLRVVDAHCAGEPARVVVGGVPPIHGRSVRDQRATFMETMDGYRKLLLTEPRGYPCQNANIIVPPSEEHPEAAYGFIILEQNNIYPAMSGHNCICVATVLLETGMIPMEHPITKFQLEAPIGLVDIEAECADGKVLAVKLRNAPAFVGALDVTVDVPEIGPVQVDIVFGGMWYVIVDAESVGLELTSANGKEICRLGEMIKVATRTQHPVTHPEMDYPGTPRRKQVKPRCCLLWNSRCIGAMCFCILLAVQ